MSHPRHQLTIRGLPPDFRRQLEREARKKGTSLNKLLLRKILPSSSNKEKGACADLLILAGTWDSRRAQDFEEKIQDHRQIDKELWS
jgi:hypothetical protein